MNRNRVERAAVALVPLVRLLAEQRAATTHILDSLQEIDRLLHRFDILLVQHFRPSFQHIDRHRLGKYHATSKYTSSNDPKQSNLTRLRLKS